MRISIELVPRSRSALQHEVDTVQQYFPQVDTINIPDLLRFSVRSWQGCALHRAAFPHTIPHIRAIDIDPKKPLAMAKFLREHQMKEVLIVTGDAPTDMSHSVYPTSALQAIAKFRAEMPEVKLYAAIDPYRQSIRAELDYAQRKLEAGVAGFFSQPFFDVHLMSSYQDLLPNCEIFWGVAPVITEASQRYWETRNRAVFSHRFRPTLTWNREFARDALAFARHHGSSVYFMPIRVDLRKYLDGIL